MQIRLCAFVYLSKARLNSGQIAFEFRMNIIRINALNSGQGIITTSYG